MQTSLWISQRTASKAAVSLFILCATLAGIANAEMQDQPVPSSATIQKALRLSGNIISERGDPARSRPELLQLIEANPAADLVEQFAPALRDPNTYTSILATYDDSLEDAVTEEKSKPFIRFNILRTLIFRSAYLPTTERRAFLKRAVTMAEELASTNKGDAAVWESLGDLYALKDDPDNAQSAYHRSATAGGSKARAEYRTAQAYQRVHYRYKDALLSYEAGIRADVAQSQAGGKEMRHLLYQGMGSLYLLQANVKAAVEAFQSSSHVRPDAEKPYIFRMELAEALLSRGYAKEVSAYAEAALKIAPDDERAKNLKARADAAIK